MNPLFLLLEQLKSALLSLQKKIPPPPVPIPPHVPIVVGPVMSPHSDVWCGGALEDRKSMYALAKKVCLYYGLSPQMTLDVLATIYGESGYNQWCINERTLDYGLCQFSHLYYLKEYKMTADEAINNPEKCLHIMCVNFLHGRAGNWCAYAGRSKYYNILHTLE